MRRFSLVFHQSLAAPLDCHRIIDLLFAAAPLVRSTPTQRFRLIGCCKPETREEFTNEIDPVQIVEDGKAGWAYEDGNLEGLLPTQKQLLRMGSSNVERLQVWLRALQNAL